MFDDMEDDEDVTDLMPVQETLEEAEGPPQESRRRRMTVSEVILYPIKNGCLNEFRVHILFSGSFLIFNLIF